MSRDIFTEAYSAMRHDLRQALLTMLGMAWGIATVVLLLAYGEGFGRAIRNIWDAFWCNSSWNLSRANLATGWRKQGRCGRPLYQRRYRIDPKCCSTRQARVPHWRTPRIDPERFAHLQHASVWY